MGGCWDPGEDGDLSDDECDAIGKAFQAYSREWKVQFIATRFGAVAAIALTWWLLS